ncbi:RibD family protein [Faunimonas sp. B44]|uniref:RibD family protein n=1 Tax=Faunimonas sp. B44 TaxID=3461493 RepID=UPI0040441291
MHLAREPVAVTTRVWAWLLDRRGRNPDEPPASWTVGERMAAALYGPLAGPAGTPFVLAQVGQSLDGRIGTPSGDCRDVSGPDGLAHLHRLRALADAVIVGADTVLSDDPRLTVRLAAGPDPSRVVLDPSGRVPGDARIWAPGPRRIAIQTVDAARPEGVEVVRLRPNGSGRIDPGEILEALRGRGLGRILIEGGARTIAAFIDAGLVDRLHVAVSAKIIGSGPSGLARAPINALADAITPEATVYALGSDILFDCTFARCADDRRGRPLARNGEKVLVPDADRAVRR